MMIECFKVLFWLFELSLVCDIKMKNPIAATSLSQLWMKKKHFPSQIARLLRKKRKNKILVFTFAWLKN